MTEEAKKGHRSKTWQRGGLGSWASPARVWGAFLPHCALHCELSLLACAETAASLLGVPAEIWACTAADLVADNRPHGPPYQRADARFPLELETRECKEHSLPLGREPAPRRGFLLVLSVLLGQPVSLPGKRLAALPRRLPSAPAFLQIRAGSSCL